MPFYHQCDDTSCMRNLVSDSLPSLISNENLLMLKKKLENLLFTTLRPEILWKKYKITYVLKNSYKIKYQNHRKRQKQYL